jgi:hypothetical protein
MTDKKVAGPPKHLPDLGFPRHGDLVYAYGETYHIGSVDKDGQGNLQVTLYKEGNLPPLDQVPSSPRRIVPQ